MFFEHASKNRIMRFENALRRSHGIDFVTGIMRKSQKIQISASRALDAPCPAVCASLLVPRGDSQSVLILQSTVKAYAVIHAVE
jgi:hypothetical protein